MPLKIDKKNAGGAPTHPFQLQLALNSSLDVFYFNVDCALSNLINFAVPVEQRLTKEDFRKFWDKLGADKTVSFTMNASEKYGGLQNLPADAMTLAAGNGFANMGTSKRDATGEDVAYFGSKTVNNLPLMFELASKTASDPITVTYKVPVPAMQPLLDSCLKTMLGSRQ